MMRTGSGIDPGGATFRHGGKAQVRTV